MIITNNTNTQNIFFSAAGLFNKAQIPFALVSLYTLHIFFRLHTVNFCTQLLQSC